MSDTALTNTLVFEIKTPEEYALAVEFTPALSEISFEAVQGHFYGLTGELQGATIPPGALQENDLSIIKGQFKPVNIGRLVREG